MNFKFLIFIFYNTVSQTGFVKIQNYTYASYLCPIYFRDPFNNDQLLYYSPYYAIIHAETGAICFMYPQGETMNPVKLPIHQYVFQEHDTSKLPHIFFDPYFVLAQDTEYILPNIIISKLNPQQKIILINIWDIFIPKRINELEPKLLDCLYDCGNDKSSWTIFKDKFGIFQKEENTKLYCHRPETLENFSFYMKINNKHGKSRKTKYLVLKGKPGPNFRKIDWKGNYVFICDSRNIEQKVSFDRNVFVGPNCIIRSNSVISKKSILNENVDLGPSTYIGFNSYLGNGCKIGIDIGNNNVKPDEKVVSTSYNRIEKIESQDSTYKTVLKGYSYMTYDIILPSGNIYYGGFAYNYIQEYKANNK